MARNAYGQIAGAAQTSRGTEYQIMAKVTHRIKSSSEAGPRSYPRLIEALSDNQRLWTALAVDVADSRNGLPQELRARIFYLAEFVQHHTNQLLTKKTSSVRPLLEINAAVLRGLAGKGS